MLSKASQSVSGGLLLMDRITNSMLRQFVTVNKLENLKESKQFEHFTAYLSVRRYYGKQFDTSDVITGNGGDTVIDAFAVLINGQLITDIDELGDFDEGGYMDVEFLFVQAERSAGFESSKIGDFGDGVRDFFREEPRFARNEKITQAAAIASAIYDRSSQLKASPTCRLEYMTTGKWVDDAHLLARMQIVKEDLESTNLFSAVEFVPSGADQLHSLYRQAQNEIERVFTFVNKGTLPQLPNVQESHIGYLPAKDFLHLITDETGELIRVLFVENPRDWLEYNPINTDIKETLETDKKARFVLMNNGITIIASSLRSTGLKFTMGGYSIVNGCQTSHVLFDCQQSIDDTVFIPIRLIATTDEDVINDIITATNRQTEVKEEQFFALRKFSKRLEAFFKTYKEPHDIYCERRSFQFSRTTVDKLRIVSLNSIIKAFASMFLDEPHRTTKHYKALKNMVGAKKDSVGAKIFVDTHRLEPYYVASFALYRIEAAFKSGKLDAKYKTTRYHLLLALRWLITRQEQPDISANKMEDFCQTIAEALWEDSKTDQLIKQAAEIMDKAYLATSKEALVPKTFDRNFVRIDRFTKQVLALLGVQKDRREIAIPVEESL
jgi:hypothetical protein